MTIGFAVTVVLVSLIVLYLFARDLRTNNRVETQEDTIRFY